MKAYVFQVDRKEISQFRVIEKEADQIGEGEVLMRIFMYAFTSNNITYGVVGEEMSYWRFFPVGEKNDGCETGDFDERIE